MEKAGQIEKVNVIYLGDCIEVLKSISNNSVDLVATDPPFNIGLKYDLYEDRKDYKEYLQWSENWLKECVRILKPSGSIFVCIGDEYQAEINVLMKMQGLFWRSMIVWYYTFGENQKNKFNRTHTVIHYFSKSKDNYNFYPEQIKVPSARQVKYKDKRAKAGGKLPDDIWESDEHENTSPSALPDDVWKISRVCGSFKERILDKDGSAHPCQMPQSVAKRIILSCTKENDLVVDPFCGTGTFPAVAHELKRQFITCDISENYAKVAAERIFKDENKYQKLISPS